MNHLDDDWILLIYKAKQLGLTIDDIQKFLKLNQKEK